MEAPDENFTEEQIEEFRKDPEFYMKFVKIVEKQVNSNFKMVCIVDVQWYNFSFVCELTPSSDGQWILGITNGPENSYDVYGCHAQERREAEKGLDT